MRVCLTGLNSVLWHLLPDKVWFYLTSDFLFVLRVDVMIGCCVLVRCTSQMTATTLQVPSRNTSPFFSTVMCERENVAVQPSSHSCIIDISTPDWRWGEMCGVFLLYITRVWGLVLPYELPAWYIYLVGLLAVLQTSWIYFHKACLLSYSFVLCMCMQFRT